MRYLPALIISAVLVSGAALVQAQEEPVQDMDEVLMVTAQDHDALVASSASNNFDIPLVETDENELTEEAMAEIEESQPEEVILIGGPEALSEEVETQIEDMDYDTERIYGETSMETSLQVSEFFWDQAFEAGLVESEISEEDMEVVMEEEIEGPIFLTEEENETVEEEIEEQENETQEEVQLEETQEQQEDEDMIPQELQDEMERLGVEEVFVYAGDEQLANQLEQLNYTTVFEQIGDEEMEEQEEDEETEEPEEEQEDEETEEQEGPVDELEDYLN